MVIDTPKQTEKPANEDFAASNQGDRDKKKSIQYDEHMHAQFILAAKTAASKDPLCKDPFEGPKRLKIYKDVVQKFELSKEDCQKEVDKYLDTVRINKTNPDEVKAE